MARWSQWKERRKFNRDLQTGLRDSVKNERGSITIASYLISEESRKLSRLTILLLVETAALIVLTTVLAILTWHMAPP